MIERQYLGVAVVNQDEIRTSALSSLLDLVDDQALLILQVRVTGFALPLLP